MAIKKQTLWIAALLNSSEMLCPKNVIFNIMIISLIIYLHSNHIFNLALEESRMGLEQH